VGWKREQETKEKKKFLSKPKRPFPLPGKLGKMEY